MNSHYKDDGSDKPQPCRKYPRADFMDYNEGDFFVTVCTKNKRHYFGNICNGVMNLSSLGEYLKGNIESTSSHFPDAKILNYVVMPNHVHLIVSIERNDLTPAQTAGNLGRLNQLARISVATGRDPTETTHHNSRLAVVIGSMKSAVTRFATINNIEFGWQSRFHDHRIRGSRDGDNIWNYIDNNVVNWLNDCFYN